MAVLKCTICGGELEVNSDLTVGVCKFCDSTIVIPKELDRKGNLYNRAVFLRQNNEFDKAVSTYEDILKEDNSDAEAHWGLVLSKYGIEYVSDPRTHQHIPTCHRTQAESILSDPDYLAALEYSDIEAQRVIEKEAKRISEIQAKILEISQKEPPYDIFICYKESDEFGNRTEDSTLAQELYYELIKKGYKVFFARKTLESKLGTEYEPIIYAALSSAKVMIVLGTKPDHFTSVWVRNEWSRFLKMSRGTHKTIIPAYRGMSPYELPAELSALQSQDMSKIGFMQDLTDGIERCMRGEIKKKTEEKAAASSTFGAAPLERLLQNSATYLKLNNYASAEEVYTTVTKDYPEDYRGWWGLIVCKTQNFGDVILDQTTLNLWYKYVKQLAPKKDFEELEKKYIAYTSKVADRAATEDMKAVNSKISAFNSQIKGIESQISNIQNQIDQENQRFKNITEADNNVIRSSEAQLSKAQSGANIGRAMMIGGGVLFGLGVIILFTGGWGILIGIAIGLVGFMTFCSGIPSNSYKQDINIGRSNVTHANNKRSTHQKEHNSTLSSLNAQITTHNETISGLQAKIADCRNYLNLGKDRIATYWFAEKCAAFNVTQEVDSQIVSYRKNAFGFREDAQEETVTITCPACGEKITAFRRELIAKGFVVCQTCGNTIEVSVSSDSRNGQSEAFYEIDCPYCGESFNVNNETYRSGHCYCKICGASIDF